MPFPAVGGAPYVAVAHYLGVWKPLAQLQQEMHQGCFLFFRPVVNRSSLFVDAADIRYVYRRTVIASHSVAWLFDVEKFYGAAVWRDDKVVSRIPPPFVSEPFFQ